MPREGDFDRRTGKDVLRVIMEPGEAGSSRRQSTFWLERIFLRRVIRRSDVASSRGHELTSLLAQEKDAAYQSVLTIEVRRVQTIFGGGNGGRSELCCSRSESIANVSTVTMSGDGIRGLSGTIVRGRQKVDGPCP